MGSLSSLVDASIRGKGAGYAAVVIHRNVGIVPLASQFDCGTMIGREISEECWPVIHVEIDLFTVSVGLDSATHSTAQFHAEDLAAGRAEIADSPHARVRVKLAAGWPRIKAHEHRIFASLGIEGAPSLPVGEEVELPAQEVSPRSEDRSDEADEHKAEDQRKE